MSSIFVLVHGAWHGAWCWEKVIPLLEAKGHGVIAPDLPGMGFDKTPLEEVSVERWAQFIAGLVSNQSRRVILLGHSRAGIVISRAAELAPENVAGLVYLSAFMVKSGQTLEEVMRQIPPRPEVAGSLEISRDGLSSTIAPDAVERVFYNMTPLDLVVKAARLSGSEPLASFTTPVRTTDARWGSIPRYYIECTRDRAIAPELQRKMYDALPCRRVLTMDCDHSPFFSDPETLCQYLNEVALEIEVNEPGGRILSPNEAASKYS